jgi:hypothetical protein
VPHAPSIPIILMMSRNHEAALHSVSFSFLLLTPASVQISSPKHYLKET